ncbi:MAG: DUF2332 family protein [Pseudomonadota bacterium]
MDGLDQQDDPAERHARVRAAFRRQSAACGKLGSPFTASLLTLLADRFSDDNAVGKTILNWPGDPIADALALRTAGALHALVLKGESKGLIDVYPPNPLDEKTLRPAVREAIDAHAEAILRFIASPPQTNEVARSAALAGGFFTIAALTSLPLDIFEIGSSAGLNLHWDRFGYQLGSLDVRRTTGRPLLAPSWEGPPLPAVDAVVDERAGCDRAPIDSRSEDDVIRLRAYIWADQADRLARLDQALAVMRSSSIQIERADAADWASRRLAERREGVTTVLFHSIVWQYIDKASRKHLEHTIEETGRRAEKRSPFAWLRMEPETPKAAALRLTLWPDGEHLYLADVDYHGSWIRWRLEPDTLRSWP